MIKMAPVFNKILKTFIWSVIIIVLLFFLIAVLIQIPAVQIKIVQVATTFVSNRTHTKVGIKNVSISFPKSVVVEGLYMEDTQKDTLFYAGKTTMNITLYGLLSKKIAISSLGLEDVTLKLYSTKTDSLFNSNFLITAFGDTSKQKAAKPTPSQWIFRIDQVSLKNIRFSYRDEYTGMSVLAVLRNSELSVDKIDPAKSVYSLNDLLVEGLTANILTKETTNTQNSQPESNLKFLVKAIHLKDNSVIYQAGNQPDIKNAFNANHLGFNHLMFEATDFQYSSDLKKASIREFSAVDQNNFAVNSFSADFSMDQQSITLNNLKAGTSCSIIDGDLNIQYFALATLIDSMQFSNLNLNLRNARIANSDLLYFKPGLIEQPCFKNSRNVTVASGKISGQMNNLTGNNLVIKTGSNTILETDFNIKGLPAIQSATFDFPNLRICSGKKDIEQLAGSYLPQSLDLPEKISMRAVFKGHLKSFETSEDLTSSFGDAHLSAIIDQNESFSSRIILDGFDLGSLLKIKTMVGAASLTAEASGQGLDIKTIKAKIKVEATALCLDKYTYHNLKIDGNFAGKGFEGKINLKDENAAFDAEGLVNLNPGREHYKFKLNLQGADLHKLNFTSDNLQLGLLATADFSGGVVNELTGKGEITKLFIVHNGKRYLFDSFLIASANLPASEEKNTGNALVGIKYAGNVSLVKLPDMLRQYLNNYFPFSDSKQQKKDSNKSEFRFGMQLHNHPILSEVFFPELKEFEPGIIEGSFDNQKNILKLNATVMKLVYGTLEIRDFEVKLNSDKAAMNYKFSCGYISNSLVSLDHFLIAGKVADNIISTSVSSIGQKNNKKLLVSFVTVMDKTNFRLHLDRSDFYLMNNRWDIDADNFIEFGKEGFLIHHFFMKSAEGKVNIASVHDRFNDDQNIAIQNFKLQDLSGIVKKDTGLIKGTVDGNLLLKRVNNSYGLIADAKITNLAVSNIPVGNVSIKAENPNAAKFDVDVNVAGADNNLTASGYFIPNGGDQSILIKAVIQSLSLQTVQAFSMGTILKASGNLTGNILVEGNTNAPGITGELLFNNAFITPAFLNNRLELRHEALKFKKDGIYFDTFTILDAHKRTATINGEVKMNHFSDFSFGLKLTTKDFLLFDTSVRDNKEFYGRMIIDSNVDISGPLALPVVNAKLKMKKGSNFTIAVPEDRLTTDKGEDVVEFESGSKLNPILNQANKNALPKTTLKGFDVSSIIEIDKEATLRLLMDPSSTDSLVVRGEAALSFAIDRSGKMSLTGAYNLNDGSYLASLKSIIKRKFIIDTGSTIIWNGDLYDADIVINARYAVRASPFDLVADQLSAINEADINGYRERYPFIVMLKLRGKILHPEISFEIQLSPEDKGILSGAVDQKLSMLNEDPSALNKQVFALLVLGRFLQENPLQSESNSASTIVRATVGKFLSQQLNQWSSKVIPGVDLNFDIQSYNDYQAGTAQGRTQVDIGLKKQLFNERLNIQFGGTVDVEGTTADQNSASDIASDVTVAYKLTKDGRFSLKGYRHNKYEGVIDGQLVETGIGVLFEHDFNKWKEFFKTSKSKNDTLKKGESNETTNPK